METVLALPLYDASGELDGAVVLHNKKKPPFTRQDLELGKIIAGHSMEAMKNLDLNQSLSESEEKYRAISDASLTGIFMADKQQNSLLQSPND